MAPAKASSSCVFHFSTSLYRYLANGSWEIEPANPIANPDATLTTEEFSSVGPDAGGTFSEIGIPGTPLDRREGEEDGENVRKAERKVKEEVEEGGTEEEGEEERWYKELDAKTIKRVEDIGKGFKNEDRHRLVTLSYNREWVLEAVTPHMSPLPLAQQQVSLVTGGIPFVGEATLGRARGEVVGGLP